LARPAGPVVLQKGAARTERVDCGDFVAIEHWGAASPQAQIRRLKSNWLRDPILSVAAWWNSRIALKEMLRMAHFFDTYDRFFRTSKVSTARRLKYRYDMLFKGREDLFRGKRVIDLGAHDGRWSFCALKAGANFVLGLEAREETIAGGLRNFEHYGVPTDSYEFRIGDAFDSLQGLDANNPRYKFDVGLCLGFFYHTIRHFEIVAHFSRLHCNTVIIETNILPNEKGPIVRWRTKSVELAYNVYSPSGALLGTEPSFSRLPSTSRLGEVAISSLPSVSAIKMLLNVFGYNAVELPRKTPDPIPDLVDFAEGRRVAILGTR
jgi:hypothetical protein